MPEGTYEPGVTVIQDAESKTGYTANFVLDVEGTRERTGVPEGAVITGVELHGSFRLISDPDRVSLAEDSDHSLYDYENGDFVANVHPYQRASGQTGNRGGEWTFEMGLNEQTGNYEISVPMVSGGHYYYYVIQYTLNGEADSVQIMIQRIHLDHVVMKRTAIQKLLISRIVLFMVTGIQKNSLCLLIWIT